MDPDALWRAIDAARDAGCREGALQPADKKLADITTPNWWQRAQPDKGRAAPPLSTVAPPFGNEVPVVEAVPVELNSPQVDTSGVNGLAPGASGSGGAVTTAPAGARAEESEKWYPGKYMSRAWNAIFKRS